MSSALSVPSSGRQSSVDGALVPAPNATPTPSPAPGASGSENSSPMDTAADNGHAHRSRPNLSAEDERKQFEALYDPTLVKDGVFCVVPLKWFESWVGYTGFDRSAIDLLRSRGVGPASAASASAAGAASSSNTAMEDESLTARRGGGERPGFMDCSPLLVDPPAHVDLSQPEQPQGAAPGQTLRSQWIELRQDVQEGVDFTLINYDAFMRLCEWSASRCVVSTDQLQYCPL